MLVPEVTAGDLHSVRRFADVSSRLAAAQMFVRVLLFTCLFVTLFLNSSVSFSRL